MSDTGRFWVIKDGRKFLVEPIGPDRPADWGSINQATGELVNKKGHGKHIGAIDESESWITEENGFKNITEINSSPLSYIEDQLKNG
ncbi:MAG TPA: hypothetical protein VK154_01345 [Chitinophagales bacterium]|nr:hypothetical protein [Chitinophagales bacterium]